MEFWEEVSWRFGKFKTDAKGDVRIGDDGSIAWPPGIVRVGKLTIGATAWRSIRTFSHLNYSHLNEDLSIARGPTGALVAFERSSPDMAPPAADGGSDGASIPRIDTNNADVCKLPEPPFSAGTC